MGKENLETVLFYIVTAEKFRGPIGVHRYDPFAEGSNPTEVMAAAEKRRQRIIEDGIKLGIEYSVDLGELQISNNQSLVAIAGEKHDQQS